FIPPHGDKFLHTLAPCMAFFPALVTFAVIPFGDVLVLGDRAINLQVADLNFGILYIFAMASLSVYGIVIGAWASNNKFSLLGGYHVEYSGGKFLMFFAGEFAEIVTAAGLMTTLFFGGWQVPYLMRDGFHFPWGESWLLPHLAVAALQVAAFTLKVLFFCWLQILLRWTVPRFRYDQVMRLGWKMLLPLALVNVIVTAIVIVAV